jgi:hypothetical protein
MLVVAQPRENTDRSKRDDGLADSVMIHPQSQRPQLFEGLSDSLRHTHSGVSP